MSDAGTQLKELEQPAALDVDGGALLSADDFAAALAEIENNGPLAPKPQAPPKPGRSLVGDEAAERPGTAEEAPPAPESSSVATEPETSEPATTPPPTPVESVAPPAMIEEPGPSAEATAAIGASAATISEPEMSPAPAVPPASATAAPAPAAPPASAAPGLKFKIGKKGAEAPTPGGGVRAAASESAAMPAVAAAGALDLPSMSPAVRLGKRLIRWAERVLDAGHRPLERISPKLLPILGVCALTTIGVSGLSLIALPILFPSRDAICYLEERVAALDAPKIEPKADYGGHGGAKAKEGPPADSHGAEKPKTKAGESKSKPARDTHAAKKDAPKKPAGAHH